jgi:4-amino-4-deoxy-L-arabinose transferase-like glycosyltransferase
VQELLGGHLKLLGPSVSGIPGFFHGVLYYYVIAPAYFFGHGSPVVVAYYLSFINAIGIFIIFYLVKKMTGNFFPSLIASLLYAVSFEQTQYATWLSNPAMGVWFILLTYIGLYLWLKEKKNIYLILLGLSFGFAIQSDVSLAYNIVPIAIWLFYSRKNLGKRQVVSLVLPFLLAVSSMILAEFRFGFTSIEGIKHILGGQQIQGPKQELGDYLLAYVNRMGDVFAYNLFPYVSAFGGLMGLGILIRYLSVLGKKEYKYGLEIKFLITWVLAYLVAASVGGVTIHHITVGTGLGLIILTAFLIWEIYENNKIIAVLLLIFIVAANVGKTIQENYKGQTIFAIQTDMILTNELKAVDYTYQTANGKPFSISTLTSPLFINTTWSYLYNWYGKTKYGYLPYWIGNDQVGQLGNDLQKAPSNIPSHFFIMESTIGIPDTWITYAKGDQESMSKLVDQKDFGQIIVQQRLMK